MEDNLQKGVALVTGGAHRVGAQIVRALAQSGYRVVIHCNHSADAADALAEELGGRENARVIYGDFTLDGMPAEALRQTSEMYGRLDLLVNNAACYHRLSLEDTTSDVMRKEFNVNFLAPVELMRQFALRRQPGCIINILDGRIDKCDTGAAAYNLSKQSLAQATRLAALSWARYGIRVNGVAPGLIRPADGVPMERMAHLLENVPLKARTTEEQVASAVCFLAQNDGVTGEILYVDGGLHLADTALGEKTPSNPHA